MTELVEKRALVVSYHAPQPDRDSGARRVYHSIELLQAAGWTVSFLASDGVGDIGDVRALQRRGVAVYDGPSDSIETVLEDGPIDVALIAFWVNAERYLPAIRELSPATRIIVDSIDLHFVRDSRRAFGSLKPRGGLTGGDAARMAAELNTYAAADGVLTVSQKEADLVTDLVCDRALAHWVPDHEEIPSAVLPFEERGGVVCVGSFEHLPNIEAVRYLCHEVIPLIDPDLLEEHPVSIIGNRLDDTVRALGRGLPHVRMVGWVPSVLPYLERARTSVVPLLYGAGTKRKLVQALGAGTPTVSTTIGIEGLAVRDGQHVLVADDPATFAQSVTALLSDADLWERLATAGRAQVNETNGKAVARERLLSAIEAVLAREPKRARPISVAEPGERITAEEYEELGDAIRATARAVLPKDAQVLVVSRGDDRLLEVGAGARHFPQAQDGGWSGFHPETSTEAITQLETLHVAGADHILFPQTAFWWLDHYVDLKDRLDHAYSLVHQDESCVVYRLAKPQPNGSRDRSGATFATAKINDAPPPPSSDETGGVRPIAFYLPQFHPIPQNDEWWGEGFTEWRNVAAARPLFPGHHQPHVPADLGFYDLRLAETRNQQADLARSSGIHGFCYYHYWFDSTRLLERPFDEVRASGEPDFPFCLCWANDPWSRRWDGRTDDLLQPQTYSPHDDVAHIRWLLPALSDPRAISVEGKPMFLVYRASHLPDPARTCDTWRREVERAGLPGIHLVAVETAWDLGWDATRVGFDAKVLFQPQFGWLMTHAANHGARIPVPGHDELQVYDYDLVRAALTELEPVSYRRYETVCPGWDNTPRVGERAVVMHNATPAAYERWLTEAVGRARLEPADHRLVFLNAWNEWAEGCHLEPDLRDGHGYLDATRRALCHEHTSDGVMA